MISSVTQNRWNSARGLKGETGIKKIPQIFPFWYFMFNMLCSTAGLPVKANKQRMCASAFQTWLASSISCSWMSLRKGKPEMPVLPEDISLYTSRDVLGYVCVVFSNIILFSIPLTESKNNKPKISNAPVNFGPRILEVTWTTLPKKQDTQKLKARFFIKLHV